MTINSDRDDVNHSGRSAPQLHPPPSLVRPRLETDTSTNPLQVAWGHRSSSTSFE